MDGSWSMTWEWVRRVWPILDWQSNTSSLQLLHTQEPQHPVSGLICFRCVGRYSCRILEKRSYTHIRTSSTNSWCPTLITSTSALSCAFLAIGAHITSDTLMSWDPDHDTVHTILRVPVVYLQNLYQDSMITTLSRHSLDRWLWIGTDQSFGNPVTMDKFHRLPDGYQLSSRNR